MGDTKEIVPTASASAPAPAPAPASASAPVAAAAPSAVSGGSGAADPEYAHKRTLIERYFKHNTDCDIEPLMVCRAVPSVCVCSCLHSVCLHCCVLGCGCDVLITGDSAR
jgi:hypothetical protein